MQNILRQSPLVILAERPEAPPRQSPVETTLNCQGKNRSNEKKRSKLYFREWQRRQSLLKGKRQIRKWDEPLSKEFILKNCEIHPTTGCWNWKMAIGKSGYGYVRVPKTKKFAAVHRVSWELHKSPIPEGMCVCHQCDNKKCCNPSHLFIGTHKDNMQDCLRKGRRHPVLTKSQAEEIASSSKTTRELTEQYGVCNETIWRVRSGRRVYYV